MSWEPTHASTSYDTKQSLSPVVKGQLAWHSRKNRVDRASSAGFSQWNLVILGIFHFPRINSTTGLLCHVESVLRSRRIVSRTRRFIDRVKGRSGLKLFVLD